MVVRMRYVAFLTVWMVLGAWSPGPLFSQVRLRGRVVDDATEHPLEGARVLLLNRYNRVLDYQVTDEEGRFGFKPHNGNRLRLEAKAVGYRPTVTSVLWMVQNSDSASLEIRLAPHVVLLAPVEIVAMSVPKVSAVLENVMFRRAKGLGVQITRQDIEQRQPQQVSDMLLGLPGVYAARQGSGVSGRRIYMGRALPGIGGGECPVQIFLDGMQATREAAGGDVQVDELVSPLDVEVIEVFRGLGTVPPEFMNRYARCGVIAIWTRRSLEPLP